jgi:hypothetical protein
VKELGVREKRNKRVHGEGVKPPHNEVDVLGPFERKEPHGLGKEPTDWGIQLPRIVCRVDSQSLKSEALHDKHCEHHQEKRVVRTDVYGIGLL